MKHGGRAKGTPNKKTEELIDICERKGVNVFEAMLELFMNTPNESTKVAMLKELASYIYPKRKALEVSNADDKGFLVVIKDYAEKK